MARTRKDNLNEDHHLVKDKNSKVSPGGDADTTDALADRDKRTKAKTKKQAKGKKRLREETSDDLRAKEAKILKKEHKRIKMQKKFVKLAKYMAAKGYINDDVVSNLTRNIRKSRDRNATSKQVGKETLNAPPTLRVAKAKARDDDAKAKDRDDSPAASNDRDIQSEVQQASGPTSPISRSSGQRQARSQIDVAGNGNPPDAAATLSADRWDSSPRRRVLARACAPTFLGEKTFDVTEDEEAEVVPISRHRKQSASASGLRPEILEICIVSHCTQKAGTKNRCTRHGGRLRCSAAQCPSKVIHKGLRKLHGGRARCPVPGCTKSARRAGDRCGSHGGGRRCTVTGCKSMAATGPIARCKTHGGGPRCSVPGCTTAVCQNKRCVRHGGFKPCMIEGCTKFRVVSGYCHFHGRDLMCEMMSCKGLALENGLCRKHMQS